MWPKAIAQLVELAPHIVRLVPMADRFFQSKTAGEEANRRAMEAMSEGLRGDLGQVTASHAGLYRQLNDQSEKLVTLASDLHATRSTLDQLDSRLARIEKLQARQQFLLLLIALFVVVTAIALPLLLRR